MSLKYRMLGVLALCGVVAVFGAFLIHQLGSLENAAAQVSSQRFLNMTNHHAGQTNEAERALNAQGLTLTTAFSVRPKQ